MKRLITLVVLSMICITANAEWVLLARSAEGDNYYADPATKTQTGNVVRMWAMADNAKPLVAGGKTTNSSRLYAQYDCDERSSHILQTTAFSGKMLRGGVVASDPAPAAKEFVAPDTAAETLLNFACK